MDFEIIEHEYEGLRIRGISRAGVATSLALPTYRLCFDVGPGFPHQFSARDIFITHAHLDHSAGIPYLVAQKAMMDHPPPRLYALPEICAAYEQIFSILHNLEGHTYAYQMIPCHPGFEVSLNQRLSIRAFQTHHRIPSLGYSLIEHRRRLKPEYRDLSKEELKDLRLSGTEITHVEESTLFTFTGDTTADFFQLAPEWARAAQVLAVECSFYDADRSVENARAWGHVHWDEVRRALPDLPCKHLLLIHASMRYSKRRLEEILDRDVPPADRSRVSVFL